MTTRPAAVLWDADGVLQHARRGWPQRMAAIDPADPDGFLMALWTGERPALRGEATIEEVVATLLRERGLDPGLHEATIALWDNIEVDDAAFEVVAAVRAAGIPSYLATNQQAYRRDLMIGLGYADRFDGCFYSCDVGAAKPEPAYFERVCAALGLPPTQVAFIDDNAGNVEAASALGLQAVLHDPQSGADGLRTILREWSIVLP